jgi:ATP-dependent helicase/nuclease subunit A
MVERGDFDRPGGRRFGALVHALLASVDLDAGADAIQASATVNGRILGATEEEIQAAIAIVGVALAHPILRRAAASTGKGGLRRETPVALKLNDGSLVEGVVDLAFREETPDLLPGPTKRSAPPRPSAGAGPGGPNRQQADGRPVRGR